MSQPSNLLFFKPLKDEIDVGVSSQPIFCQAVRLGVEPLYGLMTTGCLYFYTFVLMGPSLRQDD
jgi:hypothetical protein